MSSATKTPALSRRASAAGLTPARPDRRTPATDTRTAQLLAGAAVLIGAALLVVGVIQASSGNWQPLAKGRVLLGSLLVVAAVAAYILASRSQWKAAVAAVLVCSVLGAAGHAWISNLGLHASSLAASVVAVVLAGVLASRLLALAVASLHMGLVLGLYESEVRGLLVGHDHGNSVDGVVGQLLLTLAALLAAEVVSRVVAGGLARALAEQRRLSALLNISSDWTWEMSATGRFTYLSPSFEKHTGRTVAEFLLNPARGGPTPVEDEDLAVVRQALQDRRGIRNLAITVRCTDGAVLTILSSGEPIFDSAGVLTGWWGVSRNITAERQAEQEQQRTEAMLNRMVRMSPDAISVASGQNGTLLMVNAGFVELSGWSEAEVLGRNATELGFMSDQEHTRLHDALVDNAVVRNFRSQVTLRSGEQREVVISAGRFLWDDRTAAVITTRDVTELERARVESDAILDNASVGIALVRARRFERLNPLFESMFGFAPQGLAGQPTSTLLPDRAEHHHILGMAHRTLGKGQALDMEHSMPHANGTRVLTRLRARAIDPAHPHESGSIWVAEDISERRRNELELSQAKQQAEAASLAKSAFLATMSHEIRTPLNGVLGLARLLQDSKLDGHKRREYLSHLEDSAQQLTSMVSDVLDMSKIEAGHLVIETIAFDLHELVASVYASFAPLGRERGLTMQQHIASNVPQQVLGDPVRVRQILANYMSNALKFTTQGQVELRISLHGAKPTVRLAVHDTGVGVAADVQARLFRPFAQADSSTTRRFGGTGLGLSICRELAQRMGGEVGMSSADSGGQNRAISGSIFWADLPLPASHHAQPSNQLHATPQRPLQGLRVLVAEDNPVNMLIADAQLTHLGATVLQAVDGAEAVQIALQMCAQPTGGLHAVLMDLHMPELDGLAATRALRANPLTAQLPVFALSAAVLDHERQQVVQAGMNGFIAKPAQDAELVQMLLGAAALTPGPSGAV